MTPGRGVEDKLHKQHCLEAQLNSNWFSLSQGWTEWNPSWTWLNGKSVSDWYSESLGFESQLDSGIFFSVDLFLTLSVNSLEPTVVNIITASEVSLIFVLAVLVAITKTGGETSEAWCYLLQMTVGIMNNHVFAERVRNESTEKKSGIQQGFEPKTFGIL